MLKKKEEIQDMIEKYETGVLDTNEINILMNKLIEYFQQTITIEKTHCVFKPFDKHIVIDIKNENINKKIVIYPEDVKIFNIKGDEQQ